MEQRQKHSNRSRYVYYGISFNDETKKEIMSLCKSSLEKMKEIFDYSSDEEQFLKDNESSLFSLIDSFINGEDYSNVDSIYKIPNDIHITTFYMGRKFKDFNHPYYSNFDNINGKTAEVKIYGFVLIPNKIIGCIIKTDEFVNNTFPHITIATAGNVKPMNTNDLMDASFGEGCPFKEYYDKIETNDSDEFNSHKDFTFLGEKEKVYMHIMSEPKIINGKIMGFTH